MKNFFYSSLCFFSLVVFSCNSSEKSMFDKINTSENADFRGVSIRSTINEVKKEERIPPKTEETDYLFYEIPLGKKEEYYTVGYSFNEKGLYEIIVDIYLENPDDALQLFQQFRESFARFGNPKQEDDATVVWTIKNNESEEVDVTLTDESENYGSGKISISFYDLAY